MNGQGGLTRTFRTKNLDDAAFGIAAHAERGVERKAARGNDLNVFDLLVAEFHHRAFAKVFFYLGHGGLKRFELF